MVYNKNVLGWLAPDARNAMTWVRILSFNFIFLYYILLYLFNIYFFRYCTDSGTHRVLRILRMDLFLFNFLYEAVATLQVTCTLYMQLTFYRGTIIHAINSNGLDVTIISSIRASTTAAGKFPPVSFRGGRHQTPAAYIFTTLTNQMKDRKSVV